MIGASGHGFGLAVFPLGAAVIATLFGLRLLSRYLARRRTYEGVWTIALFMYGAASLAMFLGVATGWSPAQYRVYWLFGAVLNVPYLFVGEAYLLIRRRTLSHLLLAATALLSVFAAVKVARAPVSQGPLGHALPLGKDVFGSGAGAYRLAQFASLPAYFLLLGGLVWSAWQMRGKPHLRNRMAGTFWIAMGATVVAIGSGIGAAFDIVPLFSVALAGGIAVMFAGFLASGRPPAHAGVA